MKCILNTYFNHLYCISITIQYNTTQPTASKHWRTRNTSISCNIIFINWSKLTVINHQMWKSHLNINSQGKLYTCTMKSPLSRKIGNKWKKLSSVVSQARTSSCTWHRIQLQTTVWNSHGQHEYLLIYSFKLKSTFGAHQFLRHLLLNDTPYSKSVWRSD